WTENLIGAGQAVQSVQVFSFLTGIKRYRGTAAPRAPWSCTAPWPANWKRPGLLDWSDCPYENGSPGEYCSPGYLGLVPGFCPLLSARPRACASAKKGRHGGALRGVAAGRLGDAQAAVAELVRL